MEATVIKQIELSGLFHKYSLEWNLNDDVNILVGINGSGKSTLLRCINALLSREYSYLKWMGVDITALLSDNERIAYTKKGIVNPANATINYEYITTFDVPLKDKRSLGKSESPLDKELQSIVYTIGSSRRSFSNYRFKATNYPKTAGIINDRIRRLFKLIDKLFAQTEKTIAIDPDDNQLVFHKDDSVIQLEELSSGEKQLLIIVFTVFLMEEEPYVLLMDEPEISLHIEWQQNLIEVIRKLNPNCQLIMATHSPSIFGKGWGDKMFFIEDLFK